MSEPELTGARPAEPDRRACVVAEQVREHYAQIPVMVIAPTAGMVFTAWVLWGAVPNRYLVLGVAAVSTLSVLRLLLYRRYDSPRGAATPQAVWARLAVVAALLSGCLWGSAAPLLYPPIHSEYDVYLLVLLTLVPIVPVAALAVYMPAFYAYYFPCMAPFIVTLALQPTRAERLTALLLVMMMGAMLTFARRYSTSMAESIRLRLELADKSAALEASVHQKTQLIAAASHDLRQPVHAMGFFLETLHHQRGGAEDRRLLGYLSAGVRSLRGMLTNMLDISRLEADVVSPRLAVVPVHELLHRLADEYAVLALEGGLVLRCRSAPAWVLTDPVLLERILRNLLSNALKFTRRGGLVLACRPHGDRVRLQVVDTGIGIAAADIPRIFDVFAQVPGADAGAGGGLGLGLAIVQRLARLLGLPLSVRSRPGRGTAFTLALPRVPAARVAHAGPEAPKRDMPPGLVLVLDDDEAVATAVAGMLALWGHRVLVCASEEQALHHLAGSPRGPDLLLADLRLGGGRSGLHAVRRIRQQLGRAVPVVLVTGDTAPARIREAFDAGHLLLHKPVDPQRLRSALAEAWMGTHAAEVGDDDAAAA